MVYRQCVAFVNIYLFIYLFIYIYLFTEDNSDNNFQFSNEEKSVCIRRK